MAGRREVEASVSFGAELRRRRHLLLSNVILRTFQTCTGHLTKGFGLSNPGVSFPRKTRPQKPRLWWDEPPPLGTPTKGVCSST